MTLSQKKKKTINLIPIYVRDDLGHAWYFCDGRIKLVLADLQVRDQEEFDENGYVCDNLEQGISLLNEYGYITGIEYDEHGSDEYHDLKSRAEGG